MTAADVLEEGQSSLIIRNTSNAILAKADVQEEAPEEPKALQQKASRARYLIMLLLCLCNAICYADRVAISIAIIPMQKEYHWGEDQVGEVLATFFVGYLMTQFLSGVLSKIFGGKRVLFIGIAFWSIFTILTPIACQFAQSHGFWPLYAVRIALGFFEGLNFPALQYMMGQWLPVRERARLSTVVGLGSEVGTLVALLLGPLIVDLLGWHFIFYIFGGVGCVFSFIFAIFSADEPHLHYLCNKAEQEYIAKTEEQESTKDPENAQQKSTSINTEEQASLLPDEVAPAAAAQEAPTPKASQAFKSQAWKYVKYFTHPSLWAVIVAHVANNYGWYFFLGWMPKFLAFQGVRDLRLIGFLSILPYVVMLIVANIAAVISDFMINRLGFDIGFTRKCFQAIASIGASFFVALLRFSNGPVSSVILMCLVMGCISCCRVGYWTNYLDIGPKYIGFGVGVGNTLAQIPGIMANTLAGWILQGSFTPASWNRMFTTISVALLIGGVVFSIFARGKPIVS